MKKDKLTKAAAAGRAGMLAGAAAGHVQSKIDKTTALDLERARAVGVLELERFQARAADTRPARAAHVLALAESIAAVGLVQPVAVDKDNRLVAGLHRLAAIRLLLAPPAERAAMLDALEGADALENTAARLAALPPLESLPEPLPGRKVPVRRLVELDAAADPDAALAAEAAENTARRAYSPAEIHALAERLRAAGYRETAGRARRGQKALTPTLAMVLGVSETTALRWLGRKNDAPPKPSQLARFSLRPATRRLRAAVAGWLEDTAAERGTSLRAARAAAKDFAAALDTALDELTEEKNTDA